MASAKEFEILPGTRILSPWLATFGEWWSVSQSQRTKKQFWYHLGWLFLRCIKYRSIDAEQRGDGEYLLIKNPQNQIWGSRTTYPRK